MDLTSRPQERFSPWRNPWVLSISFGIAAVVVTAFLVRTGPPPREPLDPALSTELRRPRERPANYERRMEALAEYRAEVAELEAAGVPLDTEQEQALLERIVACQEGHGRQWAVEFTRELDSRHSRQLAAELIHRLDALEVDIEAILTAEQRRVARFSSSACTSYIVDDERLRHLPDVGQGWPESEAERNARVKLAVLRARMIGQTAYASAVKDAGIDHDDDIAMRRILVEAGGTAAANPEEPTVAEAMHDPRPLFSDEIHPRLLELLGEDKLGRLRAELTHIRVFVDAAMIDYAKAHGLFE